MSTSSSVSNSDPRAFGTTYIKTATIMKEIRKTALLALLALVASVGMTLPSRAQDYITYALVDMQYILTNIPQYKEATEQLQETAKGYTAEVKKLQDQAGTLYADYRKQMGSLSADQRASREKQIVELENRAAELQQKYFGPKGEMAKLQEQRIKPIQDKVYEAIKLYSRKYGVYMVLDRAAGMGTIVYADPAADISNDILKILGISVK